MAELYCITGPSGLRYIGVTKYTACRRFKGHCNSAFSKGAHNRLARALRRYGAEAFKVQTLLVGPWEYIHTLEDHFIQALGTRSPRGYNLVAGGYGGDPTDEVREKIGRARRGKPAHPNSITAAVDWHASNRGNKEYHAHQSRAAQAAWNKKDHRSKMMEVLSKVNSDPDIRRDRSERMKRLRQDPGFNRRLAEAKKRGSSSKKAT